MTARLKKAADARAWVAERCLAARLAVHAARLANDEAAIAAARHPTDELAQKRARHCEAAAVVAEREWERFDRELVATVLTQGKKP